jgi:hypothetical protein
MLTYLIAVHAFFSRNRGQQKIAPFLCKSGKLCYTINHSLSQTRALAGAERGETHVAERRSDIPHNLRLAAGIFLV